MLHGLVVSMESTHILLRSACSDTHRLPIYLAVFLLSILFLSCGPSQFGLARMTNFDGRYPVQPTAAVTDYMQAGNCLLPGVLGRMRCPKCCPEGTARASWCPANTTAGALCPSLPCLCCTFEVLSALVPCSVLLQSLVTSQAHVLASGLICLCLISELCLLEQLKRCMLPC